MECRKVASREWILIEQTRHHGRIKVGAYALRTKFNIMKTTVPEKVIDGP
jgi:hypothetical protein